MLDGKEILLGVCGSIAAYKAAELARLFLKEGAKVQVVMTRSACEFITPLTFFSLTGREAYSEMYSGGSEVATAHISLARRADLVVIAPATARTLGRIAHGLAEDLLSTAVIASHAPLVLAPAMNPQMFQHPAVQANLQTILSWPRSFVIPPGLGEMACGEVGFGRLSDLSEIIDFSSWVLSGGRQDLQAESIVVTAGPTFEDLDPVRYLTNRSTGKMGFALARAAARRGASVSLVTALSEKPIPSGCRRVPVHSALEMQKALLDLLPHTSALLMCAAVADYRPETIASQKIKKADGPIHLPLVRNPDILASLPPDPKRITIGFAAETNDVLHYAQGKLQRKGLDLIVANDVTKPGSGFGSDTNQVTFLAPDAQPQSLPLLSKDAVADAILDRLVALRSRKPLGGPTVASTTSPLAALPPPSTLVP